MKEGALNNLPDDAAHATAIEIQHLAEGLTEGDICLVLISGGWRRRILNSQIFIDTRSGQV